MPKARKPNAGRNPGFLPQQQKSPCPPERLIPNTRRPKFPGEQRWDRGNNALCRTNPAEGFFMYLKAYSHDSALNLRGHYPRAFPQSCPVSWFPAGCGRGVRVRFQKWGISNRFLFPFCSQHGAELLTQGNFRCRQLQLSGFVRQRQEGRDQNGSRKR